jgi:hypothetical protein
MIDDNEIFNKEIVRELLSESNPHVSDEDVDKIWAACSGNPWNAAIMYDLLIIAANK